MGHLNFYASTHQGKLPKLARYLNKRISRALNRDRRKYVINTAVWLWINANMPSLHPALGDLADLLCIAQPRCYLALCVA